MNTRLILSVAAIWLAITSVQAQLSVGGLIGLNIASVSVKPDISSEEYKSRAAIAIGGVVEYDFMDNLSVRAEPMIIGKGASVNENGENPKYAVSYLEIPLLLKYSFELSSPDFVPYVIAGPSIGFLTSAKVKYDGNKSDIKDETKGVDFSVTFGAGLEVPQDGFIPFIELRYAIGFSNINAEVDIDPDESKVRNRGFLVAIGARVPLSIN